MNDSRIRSWRRLGLSRRERTALRMATKRRQFAFESLEHRRLLVVNAATSEPMRVPVGAGYDGVVAVGNTNDFAITDAHCSGTVLWTGRHILTAAHCVDSYNNTLGAGSQPDGLVDPVPRTVWITIPQAGVLAGRTFPITVPAANIFIPKETFDNNGDMLPDNNYDGTHAHGSDIAIMVLPELAPFIAIAEQRQIYRGTTELDHGIAMFLGYGGTNTVEPLNPTVFRNGGFGHDESFGVKRIGYNVLDSTTTTFSGSGGTEFDHNLRLDLDDPNGPTPGIPQEAMSAQGDSGGPLLLNVGDRWVIAGVTSGAGVEFGGHSDYTRVSRFVNWIDNIVDDPFDLVIDMAHQFSGVGSDQISFGTAANITGEQLTITINGHSYKEQLSRIRSITLQGSGSAETVTIAPGFPKIRIPITISGGFGSDTLIVDDSGAGSGGPKNMRMHNNKIERETPAFPSNLIETINFSGIESVSYTGSSATNEYFVHELPLDKRRRSKAAPTPTP